MEVTKPLAKPSLPVVSYLMPLNSSKHEMTARVSTRVGGQQLTTSENGTEIDAHCPFAV